MKHTRNTKRPARYLVLALVLLAAASAAHASTRVCSTAEVGAPFLMPDGTMHEAGQLTICVDRETSPVSYLHRAYVDRFPVGLMMSRREEIRPEDGQQQFMLFSRDTDVLRLLAFAVPDSRAVALYRLEQPARVKVEQLTSTAVSVLIPTALH